MKQIIEYSSRSGQINDWFEGLASLHWNDRQKQLPFNPCYIKSESQSHLKPSSSPDNEEHISNSFRECSLSPSQTNLTATKEKASSNLN